MPAAAFETPGGKDMSTEAVPSAMNAQTVYKDMLVRSSTSDTGQVPFSGTASSSPDIIPAGNLPKDPLSFLADMGKDYGQNVIAAENNYLYARGVNLASKHQNGAVHLYWSRASLLQYPSQWSGNELPLDTEKTEGSPVEADQGANFVTLAPFLWKNVPTPPPGDHYCLVGRMVTADDPNPIPDLFTLPDFAAWIAQNRGMSWRNITVVNDPRGPVITQQALYEQKQAASEIYVQLICENMPTGAEISLACGTPGPQPLIQLTWTKITEPNQIAGVQTKIPQNWTSNITYSFRPNGTKPAANAKLKLQMIYIVPPKEALEALATPLRAFGVPAREIAADGIEPTMGICFGSYESVFTGS
jgi:hypothetical protein